MPTETVRRPRSATGDMSLALGWIAVLAPVVYMTVVGENSGEHGGTVIDFGLIATLFRLGVWGSGSSPATGTAVTLMPQGTVR